jgi:serine/threonine protein phosphatase PrpC
MLQPRSLQQRFSIFMIFPVLLLLIIMGIAGFVYARSLLLSQWREAAILKLQRAAHQVDMRLGRIKEWIRVFNELEGEGIALGIDDEIKYKENVKTELSKGQIIVIGTDGLWETQNKAGEMFGKERLKVLIREHAQSSAEEILTAIIDSITAYRGSVKQEDDVTLVVTKYIGS